MSRSTRTTAPSRSVLFYMVLIFVVGPVYAAVPLAWAFVLYALWTGGVRSYTLPGKAAFFWAVFEVIFSVLHYTLTRRVDAAPPPPPTDLHLLQASLLRVVKAGLAGVPSAVEKPSRHGDTSHDEEQDAKERGSVPRSGSPDEPVVRLDFHDPRARDFRSYMSTWFHKNPWSHIHIQEMRQWLYWCIFNAHPPPDSEVPPTNRAAVEDGLALVQKRAGVSFRNGSNPECRPLLLTLDPVTIHPRPLAWYALVWAGNQWINGSLLREFGLEHGKCGGLEYLIRLPEHTGALPPPRPLIFIHGLGLGPLQYYLNLRQFFRMLPSRPIIIPLQPHISHNIFHPRFLDPPSREESVRCLTELIQKMGWTEQGVDMLSHSNGSVFHTWMLKASPELIKRSCFIDPITFCLWEGDVCYNFVYRPCTTVIQLIMRYFVGCELGVANVIRRHFNWADNSLWFEDIPNGSDPRKAMFFLGGKDVIVDSERVKRYLRAHGVRKGLRFDPKGSHGQALVGGGMKQVMAWLQDES